MSQPAACSLSNKHCVPCRGGVPPMEEAQARTLLAELPGEWQLLEGATKLSRAYKFKNFRYALAYTNALGEVAEAEGHHPDLKLGWGYVEVVIQTHKIGGLTESDFILAAKAEQIFVEAEGGK